MIKSWEYKNEYNYLKKRFLLRLIKLLKVENYFSVMNLINLKKTF